MPEFAPSAYFHPLHENKKIVQKLGRLTLRVMLLLGGAQYVDQNNNQHKNIEVGDKDNIGKENKNETCIAELVM